ncbi:hypothetical protein Cgig2_024622 [Carnegiea gigantea]|uniref:DUF7792 domain-containing protein n=1 Tax=Carnegiea gigantea TaxID=171969 RepID=A0A9Q1K832_9CARY|nr:hypothetical protein Cgig2_024622 [Carnegiea gigantea]
MEMVVAAAAAALEVEEKRLEDELSYPIVLSDRIRKAVSEAVLFKAECTEVGKQVDRLSTMLRSAVRTATISAAQIYDRPLHRISVDVTRNLNRALTLVNKCRRRSFFHRVVNIVGAADFRKIFSLLDASIGDMRWLLSILDGDDDGGGKGGCGPVLSLPPIASNDPILSWVWSFIATVQMGQLSDRIEAANELAALAQDNDRNKKMIVEEGGIPPLLKLLKEGSSSDAQIAAASALYYLSNDEDRVRRIVGYVGVPLIVQVLTDSPMRVQINVANLIARMAEYDVAKEEFARENVIGPLVSLLSFETFDDEFDHKRVNSQSCTQSFHSIVQINKEKEKKEWRDYPIGSNKHRLSSSYSSFSSEGGSSRGGGHTRKERENESPEVKTELKISCAKALWMLAKDSISNSRRITETKGLLCLAKLIEKEKGELQKNCLMAIMEITSAAESNPDLRRSAFKTNSPPAKAVVEQLLRVIKESSDPTLQTAAVKSIGSLSRTFPAKETRVICPLVDQLNNKDPEVATEAAIALGKFASSENFLCHEHSKAIIEFNGVLPLLRFLRVSERAQVHGLTLLCYLAINGSDNEALEQARVLTALEGVDRAVFAQQPERRELIAKAIYHLRTPLGSLA